ncbi:MAG: hypothetical protein Ta2E_01350 [Mycoplasmoidaceae bacterium]|nr:MAG: hypothetical protein Ta2E_01350 [Mycoplasmoidaceae bacterium]
MIFEKVDGTNVVCNLFRVKLVRFDRKIPGDWSIFQGIPYDTIGYHPFKIIELYHNHICVIICGSNLDLYSFIISWI